MIRTIDILQSTADNLNINFDYEKWPEESRKLSKSDLDEILQGQKLPLIFLLLDVRENYNRNSEMITSSLNIYIFNTAEENLTSKQRNDEEFPELIEIEENLYDELESIGVSFDSVDREELFSDDTSKNKLNNKLNGIYLTFDNFNFDSNNCKI